MEVRARPETQPRDLAAWSESQVRLIKKALCAYRGRIVEGRSKLSWAGVQADIKDATGVDMGGKDTLRQFIAGTRQAPMGERCRAIVEFLTHPDVDAMTLEEFLEPEFPLHAPRQLLSYMRNDLDPTGVECPLDCLSGQYRAQRRSDHRRTFVELTISKQEDWILHVSQIEDQVSVPEGADPNDVRAQRAAVSQSRKHSTGWAILTPEDNILFFMKDNAYGVNHYYQLLCEVDIWLQHQPPRLVLLRADYPPNAVVSDDDNRMAESALRELKDKAIVFKRDDGMAAVGGKEKRANG